jgi:hypothetical protein
MMLGEEARRSWHWEAQFDGEGGREAMELKNGEMQLELQ